MKWLGLVSDPKDLTTKEYVDNADNQLNTSIEKSLKELDENKVDADDITAYSAEEVQQLWNVAFSKVQ